MNKISLLVFIIVFGSFANVFGQTKNLSMKDAVIGYWRGMYPKTIYGSWQPQTHIISYVSKSNIVGVTSKNDSEKVLASKSEINSALVKIGIDTLSNLPYMPKWNNEKSLIIRHKNGYSIYNIGSKSIEKSFATIKGDKNLDFDALSSNYIATTNDNDLFIITDKNRVEVASSDDKNIVYGQSVSRNEFGIEKGTFWSPKHNFLAYYIKNNHNVKDYPLVDITKREAVVDYIKYPMAGMGSENVSLGVYNVNKKLTVYIEANDTISEKYLTNITWSPDEKYIYIQVLNREQNHMKLNKYDVSNGKLVQTLLEERNDKYVEPLHPLIFIPNNPNEFIYQSRNNGFNHMFLYTTNGKLVKQLTSGSWEVKNILGFDAKSKNVFFMSTKQSPIERHLYKVNIKSSKLTQLTKLKGTHSISMSTNGSLFFDRFSSSTVPGIVQILNSNGKVLKTMLTAKNPLTNYKLGEMTIGTIKAADGKTDLYYRLIKPTDFDPAKKYPAIIYVYGGPHAQLVNDRWLSGGLWNHYMAEQGYVILTVDNRGSDNRGLAFENVIHRHCGQNEMSDQLKGIDFLNQLGYVDTARIGVHGWSYGGFMTVTMTINHPEIFKVAVAGGPVIDWKYYEVMYGERYMDKPDENPEGYKNSSLISKAKDLKSKLLIIHGGIDPTVVQQHSLLFVRECIKKNVPIDYFTYPRSEHNVSGVDRVHLMQKITDYFNDNLK